MKKRILFLFFLLYTVGMAYVQMYPIVFDKNIDNGGEVVEYSFINPTQNKLRYIFYVEKGKEGKDMSEWVEMYPKTLILNPQQEKTLKMYINAPKGTPKGEYTAVLGIKELPIASEEKFKNNEGTISLLADLKIELAGFVGDEKLSLTGRGFKFSRTGNNYSLEGKILNNSNRRGNIELFLQNSNTKEEYLVGRRRIFAKGEIDISIKNEVANKNLKNYNVLLIKNNDEIIGRIKL